MSGYTEKSKYELQHLLTQYQIYSEPYKSILAALEQKEAEEAVRAAEALKLAKASLSWGKVAAPLGQDCRNSCFNCNDCLCSQFSRPRSRSKRPNKLMNADTKKKD
jgi:hypothetical protein